LIWDPGERVIQHEKMSQMKKSSKKTEGEIRGLPKQRSLGIAGRSCKRSAKKKILLLTQKKKKDPKRARLKEKGLCDAENRRAYGGKGGIF